MAGSGWVHSAVAAVLGAALVVLVPASPAVAAADITLTFTISSSSSAASRFVTVTGPDDSYFFDETDGTTLTVTGQPGEYSVAIDESGGPQGDWGFYGATVPATYAASTTVPVTVPLHTLALDVEYPGGAPAPADISLNCYDAHPAGWSYAETYASRSVNGVSNILVTDHAAGDEPCDLTVDPVDGAFATASVPGNLTTFTYVVQQEITLTYNLSPLSGTSREVYVNGPGGGFYAFDETDGNSVVVQGVAGQYSLEVYEYGGPVGDWSFYGAKTPATYAADTTVPVAVPLHPLALDVESPGGSPVPATVSLTCLDGHPPGWTSTETYANRAVNGTSTFQVANHAAGDDPCDLSVDPTVGDPGTAQIPGNASSYTYTVVQDPNDITLTFNLSTPSNAASRQIRVYGPDDNYDFTEADGTSLSVTGPQGDYSVLVYESGGPQGSWSFSGQTETVAYTASATVPLTVPLHTLALDVEYPGGAPAPASVSLQCPDGQPAGWVYAQTSASRDVNGVSSFLVADQGPGGGDCDLEVDPDAGPLGYATFAGSASSFTYVVPPGAHVTGTLSDGLGNTAPTGVTIDATDALDQPSGSAQTNAAGQYDLLVDTGTHVLSTPWVSSPEIQYRLDTAPVPVAANVALDLAPATDPLTVHLETAGGTPIPSEVQLDCSGTPDGQSLIDWQSTSTVPQTGTDFVLPAMATSTGGCILTVDPTVGVRQSTTIDVPAGGDEITVVVDPGITVTGQVTVPYPDPPSLTGGTVTWSPSGHESATVNLASNGTFTLTGVAAGPGTIDVDVNKPGWGNLDFQRSVTLVDGDTLALAPHLDFLDLYLLDITGNAGTGTATLSCAGNHAGDLNDYTSVTTTRSGTGTIRLPGYAADAQTCQLSVTWSDNSVANRNVTLDPSADTALTLLKNGVTINGDLTTSNDDDGVADATEAYAPNMGDGDDDGTPDYEQADVASLPENGAALGSGEDYVTVAGPGGSTLVDVTTDDVVAARAASVDGPPDGSELPQGLVDFTVADVAPGSTVDVVLHVPTTAGMNAYAVLDPDDGTWSEMPASDVSFTPTTITLSVTDGGPLDEDDAAGRIRHPGGGTKVDVETPVVAGRTLSDPNPNGWHGGNVIVRWTVTDDKDTIGAPVDTVISTEGDDVTATSAQVCDRRGNCATGKLQHLKIDKTKPVVNLTGPANGATYTLGAVPSRSCTGTDPGGSGVPNGGACAVTVSGGTGVGTVTVVAKATDRAGNTATKTISYKVAYKAGGLVAPTAGSKLKVFKQGSTVVVRLKLLDAKGAAVTPAKAPAWVKPKAKGKSTGKVNQKVNKAKPDKGSVLIKRGSFWEYRWGTAKAKAGKAYVITVRLDDGTTRTVTVGIG